MGGSRELWPEHHRELAVIENSWRPALVPVRRAMSVELRLTTNKPQNFYLRAARSFLEGLPAKDDKPAKPPLDTVTLSALGNAIAVGSFIAGVVEKEGLAKVS